MSIIGLLGIVVVVVVFAWYFCFVIYCLFFFGKYCVPHFLYGLSVRRVPLQYYWWRHLVEYTGIYHQEVSFVRCNWYVITTIIKKLLFKLWKKKPLKCTKIIAFQSVCECVCVYHMLLYEWLKNNNKNVFSVYEM